MRELFPMIQPQMVAVSAALPLYKETAWDFQQEKPLFRQGNPVIVTGKEAVKVWIWKALKTQRTRYEIYTWDFGSDLETLIGQNYISETKQAEAARYVREALEINPYITYITKISVSFSRGDLKIEANVKTVYGEVNMVV